MHPALRSAESAFRHFLDERGRGAPALVQVSYAFDAHYDRFECCALFTNGIDFHWIVRADEFHYLRHPPDPREFDRCCHGLYSQLYEDHLLQLDLRDARLEFEDQVWLLPSASAVRLRHMLDVCQHQIQEAHYQRRHPIRTYHVMADLERPGEAISPLPLGTTWVDEIVPHLDAGPAMTATQVEERRDEAYQRMAARIARDTLWFDLEWLNTNPVGDDKAAQKGEVLLKEWLSPQQLAQYEESGHFEVVGSTTGKCYRIREGRQMNIDELDEKGEKVCTWCFLPEGHLVAGDVMLAQKIALETCETEALQTANRFAGGPVYERRTLSVREILQRYGVLPAGEALQPLGEIDLRPGAVNRAQI